MVSVMPFKRNCVPSVAISEGILNQTVTMPFSRPTDGGDEQCRDNTYPQRETRLVDEVHDERCQGKHLTNRKIDFTADEQHDFAG